MIVATMGYPPTGKTSLSQKGPKKIEQYFPYERRIRKQPLVKIDFNYMHKT